MHYWPIAHSVALLVVQAHVGAELAHTYPSFHRLVESIL